MASEGEAPTATSTAWFQRHHQPAQQPLQQLQHLQQHVLQQQHPQQQLLQQPVQYQPAYQPPLHLYQQQAVAAPQQAFQYEYQNYQLEPELVYEVAAVPQVVKKKPSYASLYPWPEKPAYRSVPLHVPSAAPSYTPQHHSGGYAGWTRIPVLDEEGGNQWVAWVPEELGDFVIVRKDKLKPKKKKVEEEEEEEPEPPKPKPKKKVKTIVEEDAPEEEPPKPKKKVKTIVEEEAPEEEPPKPKKKIKTIVEDEVPPKKTTKTTVTTEEQGEPGTSVKETSTSSDTRVTKTEVIEQASTMPESVSVPAPTK
ncbi:transcription factor SPT20 homolog [Thrips palmi]|uniref:Transcription factor SPT20 homolog n=1 Tax=Thrips palmi TaxID=161013 RepID=A0A6P9A840_THRPL|nr:transcription factor SPT20 homolog [Thrips palmi]